MSLQSPYVAFALMCERVLQEQDGVLSAIRIVDKLNLHTAPEEKGAAKLKAGAIAGITILIGLKSGDYKGSGVLSLKAHSPDGKVMTGIKMETEVELRGGHQGANVIISAGIPFAKEGVYWIDVIFKGRVLTRMPLSVSVFPSSSATPEPDAKQPVRRRSSRKA